MFAGAVRGVLLGSSLWIGVALAQPFDAGHWIDLSHSYSEDTIYWPTEAGFVHEPGFVGMTDKGYYYSSYSFESAEHGGTHIDAPVHFAKGRKTVDQLDIEQLIGPAAVIDVGALCEANRDYQVAVADIERWEGEHGRLPDGVIVLLNTNSSRYWPDREEYMGTDERGDAAVAKLHFPGLHPETAAWLVENRAIGAIGLDTPSIDYGQSTMFESHRILFEADIPALENVAKLNELPATGATVIALPMKIEGGSGGPTRIVAWVPD